MTVTDRGNSRSTCALDLDVGDRTGLVVHRDSGGRWVAGSCDRIAADRLLKAAEGLPPVHGHGPISFVAAGDLGEARTVALDRLGNPLGYGAGRGIAHELDVCPGSERLVEVATPDEGKPQLVVREIRSLRVVTRHRLEEFDSDRRWRYEIRRVTCLDGTASEVVVFGRRELGPEGDESDRTHGDRVLRVTKGKSRTAWTGRAGDALFDAATQRLVLALEEPARLGVQDPESRAVTTMTDLPRPAHPLALAPGGVAAFVGGFAEGDVPELFVAEISNRKPAVRVLLEGAGWARAVVFPTPELVTIARMDDHSDDLVETFSVSGERRGRWTGWRGFPTATAGGRLYGIAPGGIFQAADPVNGDPRPIGTLPAASLSVLAAVDPAQDGAIPELQVRRESRPVLPTGWIVAVAVGGFVGVIGFRRRRKG